MQIIGSKSFGGAERWFQRFSLALAERGHAPELAVRKGYELDADHWHGLVHHPLHMRTVWDPLSKGEVSRLIRQLGPAVVQTYMGRATRLTHLAEAAGSVHIARIGGYYKLDGYRHAHAWIGNTRGVCDYLLSNGFPRQRIFHIYNFYELPTQEGEIANRSDWGIPEEAWVLMTPGRLVSVKGHKYLLEAMGRLPRELAGRPLWLLVLGDGPLKQRLVNQAKALGLDNRVVWAGWQVDPAPFFRLTDMVVFPSRDAETFGNVILEAWAYSKPLVTTAFRGAREIVRAGTDAVMAPCEDAQGLADSIRQACEDQELMESITLAGRVRLREDFSKQVVMAQYIDLYRKLIDRH